MKNEKIIRIDSRNPYVLSYIADIMPGIICDDILEKEYQLKTSITYKNSRVRRIVSKNFSEFTKCEIRDLTIYMIPYLPHYISKEKFKETVFNCIKKALRENPEYIEDIEKRIIQENKAWFDGLAEHVKEVFESRKKLQDEITLSETTEEIEGKKRR